MDNATNYVKKLAPIADARKNFKRNELVEKGYDDKIRSQTT